MKSKSSFTSIFSAILLISFLTAEKSFAWTSGHIIGVEAINTRVKSYKITKLNSQNNNQTIHYKPYKSDFSNGLGFSYKYAFINKYGYWFAPGIIFEQNSFGSSSTETDPEDFNYVQIKNRFGVKADLGFDVTKKFSTFLSLGFATTGYEIKTTTVDSNINYISRHKSGYQNQYFLGGGILAKITNHYYLSFEYNYQKNRFASEVPQESKFYLNREYLKTKLNIFKIGLLYNF